MYLFSQGHSSFNGAATSIGPSNINRLQPTWHWRVPPSPNSGTTALLASPTVVNGVVYIGAKDGLFYAVREATQKPIWSRFLGIVTPKGRCSPETKGITSTADAARDPATGKLTIYVNAADGYLYALDAATGHTVWKGLVGVPSPTANDYYAWSTPLVAQGKVYVGISSDCDTPLVPAGLLAFDQRTGHRVAWWHSLPSGQSGASIWSSPAASGRAIFATTGNHLGTEQPLYADSIVKLDGSNLHLLDYWQVPASEQAYDADFGASPTMFTARLNGVTVPMVGVCNKNGLFYALRRDHLSAGPVWKTRITRTYVSGSPQCLAAAIWDGTRLIVGGGDKITINGKTYDGSVVSLNPATGKPIWRTGLAGGVLGTPTEDGSGVVAAPIHSGATGVYLLDARTGKILHHISLPHAPVWAQPVFAGKDLLVAGPESIGLTAYGIK
jgi:polyvinyl alcohol dehydrogenase (cytochrome)